MPEKIHIGIDLEGELARAFTEERRKTLASKAQLARAALVFFLNAKGYDVEDATPQWGGYRERSKEESEEGQMVAVA